MIDLTRLAAQGRAHSAHRAWTAEELDALILLETERGLSRPKAADFVRNGIMTVEALDKATKSEFVPKTMAEATAEVEKALMDNEFATKEEKAKKKTK